jgi:serine/threonine-protein kinase
VDLLGGLQAAHEARDERGEPLGIVHRDISPANVIVGVDGVAKILDFGVAKAHGRLHLTRDRQLKGKLAYMAPEQMAGQAVDARADVYAASVVLWELLVAKPLFDGPNEAVILHQVTRGEVSAPSAAGARSSAELDAIVLRGLSRDRDMRFPSAKAMADAVALVAPLAPRFEVAAWVRTLARSALASREERRLEAERSAARMGVGPPRNSRSGNFAVANDATEADESPTDREPDILRVEAELLADDPLRVDGLGPPSEVISVHLPRPREPLPYWVWPALLLVLGLLGVVVILAWPAPSAR